MELTMNQTNSVLGNGNLGWGVSCNSGWNLPEFGIQKMLSEAIGNIFHTIHHSFDYKGCATTRELITFLVFAVLMQVVLIPTETYTTDNANLSMLAAATLADVVACILPGIALVRRWMK